MYNTASTVLLKIIMPSEVVFQTDATMVNIPGSDGVFGVLPGHAKLISSIKVGLVSVFVEGIEKKFFIYGGIAEVNNLEVNIVSEFAVNLEDKNKSDLIDKISNLKTELESCPKDSLKAKILEDSIMKYNSLLNFVGH